MKRQKNILFVIAAAGCVNWFFWIPFNFAGILGAITGVVCFIAWPFVSRELIVNKCRGQKEDLFIVSLPRGGKKFDLPETIKEVVIWAPHRLVMRTVKKYEDYLNEAENVYFIDKIGKARQIQVFGIIQGDGEHVDEDDDEFAARAIAKIKERRRARHGRIKKEKGEHYHKEFNNQAPPVLGNTINFN
jgi:hypothetical protein